MRSPEQKHRALAGISRSRILQVLGQSAHAMEIRELAAALSLHPNTVRQHLDQLVEAGLVTCQAATPIGRGRPAFRYAATPGAEEQDPAAFRDLARVLAEQLGRSDDGGREAVAAGESWGRALAREATELPATASATARLVLLLDQAGFAPDQTTAQAQPIRLRRCPFGTLARDQGSVVCRVHLGLIRGILREFDAPFDVTRLDPLVKPALCLVYLEGRSDG